MNTDVHGGRTLAGNPDHHGARRWSPWRIAGWSAAALLLLLPLVAMPFTDEVNWTAGDFVFAAVLLLGVGIPAELVVRKTSDRAYRAAVGLALSGAFLLLWSNGAVGLTDSNADRLYLPLVALGIVGAFVVRFRPAGMAVVLSGAALALMLVGGIALLAGVVPAYDTALVVLGPSALFAALFAGSAVLFRKAARGRAGQGEG